MKMYVVSTGKDVWAFEEGNVIATCMTGPYPLSDAKSYALDHTKATDKETFVYEVELRCVGSMKVRKEVVFAPAQ